VIDVVVGKEDAREWRLLPIENVSQGLTLSMSDNTERTNPRTAPCPPAARSRVMPVSMMNTPFSGCSST